MVLIGIGQGLAFGPLTAAGIALAAGTTSLAESAAKIEAGSTGQGLDAELTALPAPAQGSRRKLWPGNFGRLPAGVAMP